MFRSLFAGVLAGLLLAAGPSAVDLSVPRLHEVRQCGGRSPRHQRAGRYYGAELRLGLVPGLALVGNVGYAKSDLQIGTPVEWGSVAKARP